MLLVRARSWEQFDTDNVAGKDHRISNDQALRSRIVKQESGAVSQQEKYRCTGQSHEERFLKRAQQLYGLHIKAQQE